MIQLIEALVLALALHALCVQVRETWPKRRYAKAELKKALRVVNGQGR